MMREIPLWVIGGAIAGGFWFLSQRVRAQGSSAEQTIMKAKQAITIPPNQTWFVVLRNGDQVRMSSSQLQRAIDANAVKTYQRLPQTA